MISGSLRGRLLWWLLLPLTVFVCIAGAMSWQTAKSTASLVQDNALMSSMRIIGEDIHWDNGVIVARILPAALELFESPEQDSVFYRVEAEANARGGGRRLLAGNPDVPVPANLSPTPVFYSATLNDGRKVRAVAYVRELYDSGKTEAVRVVVAKTERSRDAMVAALWHPQLLRLVLMLVLSMVLVYLGLTFELRPLMKLKDDVADRKPSLLQPIRDDRLHTELRPIVDAINRCIARMGRQAITQRQFVSDAAHQLRTPLTLLDAQIQFARQRGSGDAALDEALAGMHKSSRKLTTLTNKLLLLAQAESASAATVRERVSMTAVIEGVFEALIGLAQRRDIDLGAELDEDLVVAGDATLSAALVMNLVDNALRYTQPGGWVTVSMRRGEPAGTARLQVADNGPGISAEARARVFERFYRASADTEGTGLGLAIVREIAARQGGSVALSPGAGGVGLVVSVDFRLWPESDAALAAGASGASAASMARSASTPTPPVAAFPTSTAGATRSASTTPFSTASATVTATATVTAAAAAPRDKRERR